MLPPFKIRNFRPSSRSAPRPICDATIGANSFESIVRISAPDYDFTVSRHPEAILKYFDEDDCDTITVGTSIELSQRLEEPVPALCGRKQKHHIFDIKHGEAPSRIWQTYEQNQCRKDPEAMQAFCDRPFGKSLETGNLDEVGIGARVRLPTGIANHQRAWVSESTDINSCRERYIEACNPPQLNVTTNGHIAKIANQAKIQPPDLLTQSGLDNSAASLSCLTTEGKRQARAAGDRIRAITSPSRYSRKPASSLEAINAQKRWAAYSKSSLPFLEQLARPTTGLEKPYRDNRRQSQSAGDKLRGRTNRVRHPKPTHQGLLTDYGITKARCENTSSSRSLKFEDRKISANKAQDTSIGRIESENETSQSLLQIFESELATAKGSSEKPTLDELPLAQDGENSQRNPLFTDKSANHKLHAQQLTPDLKRDPLCLAEMLSNQGDICRPIHQAVDDIEKVLLELQKPAGTPEENRSFRIICEALQLGLLAALQSLGACMQNISDTVQETLVDSSSGDLQKLLTAIRCSARKPPVHFSSDLELSKDSKSQHHNQGSSTPGTSMVTVIGQRERITPKFCLSTHSRLSDPSDCLEVHNSIDGSANSSSVRPMPFRPRNREQLVAKIARETAGDIVTSNLQNNPEAGGGQDTNVFWHTQEVHGGSPGTLFSVSGPSHKTSKITNEGPSILYKESDISHMDGPLGLSCETISKHPRFPPLPTMEPLIPYNEADLSNSHCISDENRELSSSTASRDRGGPSIRATGPVASEEPGVINAPPSPVRATESSGQFFNRMTGRGREHSILRDQYPACIDGIRRNATIAGRRKNDGSSNYRPYTIHSSGNTRIPWSSVPQRPETPPRGLERLQTEEFDTRPEATTGEGTCMNHSQSSGMLADMAYAVDHSDAATAGKIQECVEQLQFLGFHHNTPDGLRRLVVYAQAAEGELSNAIDMIDEEQKAYNQRQ